jgi:hypothetical protein
LFLTSAILPETRIDLPETHMFERFSKGA